MAVKARALLQIFMQTTPSLCYQILLLRFTQMLSLYHSIYLSLNTSKVY